MKLLKNILSTLLIMCLLITSISSQSIKAYATPLNTPAAETQASETSKMDETVPVLSQADINGTILTLSFGETLNAESIPSKNDFTIQAITTGEAVTLLNSADITEINVYDNEVALTLADSVASSSAVTLDYDPSGDDSALRDQSGNLVERFSDYEVSNITGKTGIPNFVAEAVYNKLDIASLSENLAKEIYYAMLDYQGSKEALLADSEDVVSILAQSGITYSELTDENKAKICSFFGISDAFWAYSEEKSESIETAIGIYSEMMGCGLTKEEIEQSITSDTRDKVLSAKEKALAGPTTKKRLLAASAAATDPFADVTYDKEKSLSAPFQHNDAANEQIDLSSGTLDYNVTDAVLPGAGGLDLAIQRQYSTDQANYYNVTARLQYAASSTATPLDSRMNSYKKELHLAKNADGTLGDEIETTSYGSASNNFIGSDELRGYYNQKEIYDAGDYYSAYLYKKEMSTSTTSYMSAKQTSNPVTRNDELWQLGTGWKFNFSYLDLDTFEYKYIKLHLSDGREFGISSNWVNNLGHYTYKDVIFATETITVAGQTSSYDVTYANGKKEYFNAAGRLIAIADRFGNTISFTYTTVNNMVEITITDTLGRITTLTNEATSTGYNKILTLPDGKTITYVINKNTARTISAFKQYEEFDGEFNEYNLSKVINQAGEETSYEYTDIECRSDFAARYKLNSGKLFMGGNAFHKGFYYPNYYAELTKITYPTGLSVNYEYYLRTNAWYDYGCMDDIAIKKRYDQQGSAAYNVKEYAYSYQGKRDGVLLDGLYNADGYDNSLPESDPFPSGINLPNYWVEEIALGRNTTTKYEFDAKRGFCVKESIYHGSNLAQTASFEYRIYNQILHPSKTKVITNCYDTSDSQAMTTTECYDYDNKGNAISYWPALSEGNTADTEHRVSMTYDALYNYLTGKTYKRDASTTIYEQNVPSANEKTVAQSLVYENGNLKAKSEFGYDAYGNVTVSKKYTDLTAGTYIETDNTYANGTYLTGVAVQNVKDADGANLGSIARQAAYDIYGRVTTETDARGNVTTYTYDSLGRVTGITYPGGSTKSYAYTTSLNQTTVTDERGYVARYQYDPAGDLIAEYSINGGTATLLKANEYDSLYRLVKEQNNLSAGGGATTYSYDYKDRVTQKSSASSSNQILSQENSTYYDDKTTKTVTGDASSRAIVTTEYTDKYGRVTKQGRFVDGTEVFDTFAYNYLGEVIKEKSARANAENYTEDHTTQYGYDFAGNVIKQYDVLGKYITTGYDAAGRKISVTDAKSNAAGGAYSTVYTYDALGRLIKEETPFLSGTVATTKYYYDANGNLTQKQVANSLPGAAAAYAKTEYTYNSKNQLMQVKSYDGSTVANQVDYEYDAAGNMTAMVTGGGTQRTEYAYDRYGHMTSLTDPMGLNETYVYDINGNLTSKTDKNGLTTNYTYDGLSRKLSQSVSNDGTVQIETKGYTLTGNLAFTQNENLRTDYTYDELGRAITEIDSNGVEKDYTYDVSGNLKTSVLKVNGVTEENMSYTYDKKDRLSEVYEAGTLAATYTYDDNGNRSSLTYGNGTRTDYAYNLANLVTSLQNKKGTTTLSGYSCTYYLDGSQAAKSDNTGRSTGYTYDSLGRLTREAESGAADAVTKGYTFDSAGNRSGMNVSGADSYSVAYAYDLNNRLLTETKEAGSTSDITDYYYDNNGNTIAKRTGTLADSDASQTPALSLSLAGAELYRYDGFDRMTDVQTSSGSSIYIYRPDGLRLSKTVNGVITTQVWEGNQIALELDGNGTVTDRYIRGIGLLKSDDNGWYLFNAHGDVVQLADNTGTVTKEYAYDAFGNEKNIDANDTNPFRYSGEYYDKETGTIYLRARYYDPETGRFLAEDSFTGNSNDPLSLNLYAYCQNDPVNGIDPSGNIMLSVEAAKNQKAGIEWATAHPVENFVITADLASNVIMVADGAYEVKILVKGVPLVIKGIRAGSVAEAKIVAMETVKTELKIGTEDTISGTGKAFGSLKYASGYGVDSYANLSKALKGTGLQAHHIVEKRLATTLGIKSSLMDSVAVTSAEHQAFTNAWRQQIPYGRDYEKLTRSQIWAAAQKVYKNYPELLKAAKNTIFGE